MQHSRSKSHAHTEPQLAKEYQPSYNERLEDTPEVKKGFFTRMLHKFNGTEQEEQARALAQEQARQQQKAEALRQQQELEKVKQMSLNYDYSKTMDWNNVAQNNPDQFFEKYKELYKDRRSFSVNTMEKPSEELDIERNKISKYQRENLESMSNIILKDDKLYTQAIDKGYREVFESYAEGAFKKERIERNNQFVKDYLAGTIDQSSNPQDVLRHFSRLKQEHDKITTQRLYEFDRFKERYQEVGQMIENMSLKIASEEKTYKQAQQLGLTQTIDKCVEGVNRQTRMEQQRALERSMDRGRGMSM